MPDLRVLTWNSSGEADGRGTELVNRTNDINLAYPHPAVPVQLVAIQEAAGGAGGSIATALAGTAPFNPQFVQPHYLVPEHITNAQPGRVGHSANYRLAHMANHPTGALNLTLVAGPALVNLDPAADTGVDAYITGRRFNRLVDQDVRRAAANMRFPVYQRFNYAGGTVHFFTWHVEHRRHWGGATFLNTNFQGPALVESLFLFQRSQFYTNLVNGLTVNDVIIIAGDLNISGRDVQRRGIFDNYEGATNNLDHVLAYSPSANLRVHDGVHYTTNYPPHNIVSARVHW